MAAVHNGRRVVTEPASLYSRRNTLPVEEKIDTVLFRHDSAKVFSFNVPAGFEKAQANGVGKAGRLPWKSRSENLETVGRLRLYLTPSEVPMLGSGDGKWSLSMMPGSKCWCVDNEAKFAMKVRDRVYRVELPYDSDEDKGKVEEFKDALRNVIKYEKAPCPFKRGFDSGATIEEELDSSKVRRRLIGTRRNYSFGLQSGSRRASMAPTEGSPEISDEDAGTTTPPAGPSSPGLQVSKRAQERPSSDGQTKPPIRPREDAGQRSFTVPVPMHAAVDEKEENSPDHATVADDLKAIVQQSSVNRVDRVPETPTEVDEAKSPEQTSPPSRIPSPDTVDQTTVVGSSHDTTDESIVLSDGSLDPEPWTEDESSSAGAKHDAFRIFPADPAPLSPTLVANPIIDSTVTNNERPITPPPEYIPPSIDTTPLSRDRSTPSTQPPPKSATTTLTSTPPVQPRRLRNTSIASEDDLPRLGLFSQTLNILLGPPSGLISVLVGIARKVGSVHRRASTIGLGSGFGTGDAGRDMHSRGSSNMPGSWDSEDDRASIFSSDADVSGLHTPIGTSFGDARTTTTATERTAAEAVSAAAAKKQPERMNEWTDDDLD